MNEPLDDRFQRAAKVLKALAHPLRLALVCGLRHQPCTQTFIADTLELPQSTVAQHLKVLRSQGVVKAERRGVEVVFSLADPQLTQILDTLCSREAHTEHSRYTWEEIAALDRARRATGAC
ncbi:MAG: winged helix-turn-helix transcriptional regulator [Candidatus Latescibacterota bacterium]|nr:MAG: winged helix-turn-helix transcriptional regulator [Candidatus Latescibacterota bacterium]